MNAHKYIFPTEMAYIPDGVVVLHELLHDFKVTRKSSVIIKLDFKESI